MRGVEDWRFADGSRAIAHLYDGIVRIGSLDAVPAYIVALGDEVILGRGIMDLYRVIFDHGERRIVEPSRRRLRRPAPFPIMRLGG